MIFTKTCRVCGRELVRGEQKLCLHCDSMIPLWHGSNDDLRAHRLPRNAPIRGIWPWMMYSNEDPVCALIRVGKFNDRPELIEELSKRYAGRLIEERITDDIDFIVPVPMHWWKKLRRGYNQSELIANAIGEAASIPVIKVLKAVRSHSVQSRKSGLERAANVAGIFALNSSNTIAPGAHIAVVDDILTTGATLSEAINTLRPLHPKEISVLTLAATKLN